MVILLPLSAFFLLLFTASGVMGAPVTSYNGSTIQLMQRGSDGHNVYLLREVYTRSALNRGVTATDKKIKVRQKSRSEYVLSEDEDWSFIFGSQMRLEPEQTGSDGPWKIRLKTDKRYNEAYHLGYIHIPLRDKGSPEKFINRVPEGTSKFDVLDKLMNSMTTSSEVTYTPYYKDPEAWSNVFMAMTQPSKYIPKGETKWNVNLRLYEEERKAVKHTESVATSSRTGGRAG
ncbi:hypothetical protein J3R30DRAFT_1089735 [Lentinula aciculospora]|uniref:Uncharacterized protein n=1 Tax=Lentinula aciculospora TaxID=153920 RepID=A0A9W9A187_9AGAR|nr:hypothetical protein J3R30DRAFT_1089735 [Lentinula aciculospora]